MHVSNSLATSYINDCHYSLWYQMYLVISYDSQDQYRKLTPEARCALQGHAWEYVPTVPHCSTINTGILKAIGTWPEMLDLGTRSTHRWNLRLHTVSQAVYI